MTETHRRMLHYKIDFTPWNKSKHLQKGPSYFGRLGSPLNVTIFTVQVSYFSSKWWTMFRWSRPSYTMESPWAMWVLWTRSQGNSTNRCTANQISNWMIKKISLLLLNETPTLFIKFSSSYMNKTFSCQLASLTKYSKTPNKLISMKKINW